MADEREKKRKKSHSGGEPTPTPARDTQDMKAGELLRHVREEKGLELEEISSAIHVRPAQLRAIEEGHIESLPGMTYALGFVKSYASYLKLDSAAVANKFKAEHSVAPNKPDLKFPEPMAENKTPDPIMIGAAVFGVIVLLVAWFFFSGGEDKTVNVANNIPAAPTEIAPLTASTSTNTATPGGTETTATAATNTTAAATPAVPVAGTPPSATTQTAATSTTTAPAPAARPAATAATPAPAPVETAAPSATTDEDASVSPDALPRPRPTEQERQAAEQKLAQEAQPAAQQPEQQETINIHPSRSRVMLEATQSTWVQVTNASGAVVLKRVLRPGDRYYVPDEPGLSLITSNAGGLSIYVDGWSAGSLGRSGEILRGIPLNPRALRHGYSSTPEHHSLVND